MSREYKELFGYTDEEIPNTSEWWQENIFPEDKSLALEAFNNHVTKGTPFSMVVRYRHKNGSTVWVRCRGKALFNDQGKPVRMLGAHNDLTPLMKVQDELRKKEAVLDLLCTTALDGFWDWNMNTGEDFLSKRWKKALGYEDDELANTVETWMSLLHPDDLPKAMDAVKRHMDEGAEYNVVLRYKRKDGTWAHMKAQGVAQKDENGNWARMFGTHTDVSYLEEARAAREASEAKSVFLATMSHEIRTPLNAVLGMAQVLMTTQLTEEQEECVTILQNSGAHLLSLINDILDLSQIESGVISIAKDEFSIQTSVVGVLDVFLLQARQRGIALTFETHVPAGTLFCGDSERICQVLFNLVGNALKFTAAGSVDVVVSTKRVNNISGVLFEVHDTVNH
jgi:PAS domain S-box-containing protein